MTVPRFHPAASLVVWLFFIVALSWLPLPFLLVSFCAIVIFPICVMPSLLELDTPARALRSLLRTAPADR